MLRLVVSALLLASLFFTQGCADFIAATRDTPIEDDPGERSWGSSIDDEIIEIKAEVNLKETNEQLADANITVVSHNGIVLLAGQVHSQELRQQAAHVVAKINRVRRVHNELTVEGKTSYLVRSNDAWITSKLKTKMLLNSSIESGRIKVVTENGVVYLLGLVTRAEADRAAELARETNGVQKVVKIFEYL